MKRKLKKEQTECKSECSINSPQAILNNIIFGFLAIDDKHKVS